MKIRNFTHKGLRRLYGEDNAKGVPAAAVDELRKMLAFLDGVDDPGELRALPRWKAHMLTGNRKGTWSLSVTANLRLTFRVEAARHAGAESTIRELNLEDYH
jgi:proteic killer suppression protein